MRRFFVFLTIFLLATSLSSEGKLPREPSFVLAGGGELPPVVHEEFIRLAGGKNARIVVIPSASVYPKEAAADWIGRDNVTILHPWNSEDIENPDFVSPLRAATGVWFCGGDQLRLADMYRDTTVAIELAELLKRGGVIGGTSAGASVVSDVMIYEDSEARGFGFLDLIVDQHFEVRKRLSRLLALLEKHQELKGVGIEEGTALILTGKNGRVVGKGRVIFCEHESSQAYPQGSYISLK